MTIVAPHGSGVRGTGVVNFGFLQGSIDQSTGGSAIAFDNDTNGTENNISGNLAITGSQLTNALKSGIRIRNFAGTLDSVQISGNTLTSAATQSASTGSGIELIASGSATTAASVMRATIDGNTIRNIPSGHGIHLQGGNPTLGGPGGTFGVPNNTIQIVTVSSNRVSGQSQTNPTGAEAILAHVTGGNASSRSQANLAIVDNGTPTDPIANTQTAISNFALGYATASSRIAGNVLAPANSLGFRGIDGGVGPNGSGVNQTPELSATVSGNTISRTDGNGILFTARAMSGTLRTKILNNTVAAPLSGVRPGIRVDSGNNIAGANRACA